MVKEVYLITKNKMKVEVANSAIDRDDILIKQLSEDTPEIQSMDVLEISKFSAKWAADKFNKPIIKMDNSLCIDALKNFPGPFVAYVDKSIGAEGIVKLMNGVENRSAKFVMAIAYCEPGREPIVEYAELRGIISKKLIGQYGWFSDLFFIPEGYDKTMGCYTDEDRKKIWPQEVWKKMAKRIMHY